MFKPALHADRQHFAASALQGGLAQGHWRCAKLFATGIELQDGELHGRARIIDYQLEQETVELCFRQGIGSLLLDGVLGGGHHKERRQVPALFAHGNLVFCHCLQQRRLHLGRRPVDLVRQYQMIEQGAGLEYKTGILRVKHLAAGQICRQQIRGELDASETPLDSASKRLDGTGFGKAGSAFD